MKRLCCSIFYLTTDGGDVVRKWTAAIDEGSASAAAAGQLAEASPRHVVEVQAILLRLHSLPMMISLLRNI